MPPAMATPDWRSPKPGPGMASGDSASGGVTPIAAPDRPQYEMAVEAAPLGRRTSGALGAAAGVDDPGVAAQDVLGLDAELAAGRRQEVGDEHVGLVHELQQDLLALGRGDVEGHGPLAAVGHLPEVRHAVDVGGHAPRRGVASGVAHHRVLDLEDVGAPVGEDRRRRRHEGVDRHLQHAHAVQRCSHRSPSIRNRS